MYNAFSVDKGLLKHREAVYFFKFISLMGGIYYFNIFYIGLTDPRGLIYSSFFAHYLDYISWLRASILHTSNLIVHFFGLHAYISDIYTLRVSKGPGVIIGFTCLGYGMMSFWIAFIMAQDNSWQKKIYWSLSGIAAIWFINCWRIGLLLIALKKKWQVNKYMEHHTLFNIVTYLLIMLMIYYYHKKSKNESLATSANSPLL